MHPVFAAFEANEGYLRRRDLLRSGMTDGQLRNAVANGTLKRIRHGWYRLSTTRDEGDLAVRVGGRLTGMAALRTYGVWIPAGSSAIDIDVPSHARALRHPGDMHRRLPSGGARSVRVHWEAEALRPTISQWRVDAAQALQMAIRMSDFESAVIVTDSCLQLGLIDRDDLEVFGRSLPVRCRAWIEQADGRAESGGETAVRLRLRAAGIRFEPQVEVPGVGHLDGRIGRRTYVEVDGYSAHGSAKSHERDHDRMLVSTLWGHQVVRLSSRQVFENWPQCLSATFAALERD